MRATSLALGVAALMVLLLAPLSGAAGEEDAYLAIQINPAGGLSYVRRSEIQAFADVSPSNCLLLLTDGEDIRIFQKCTPFAAELQDKSLISFPNEFGKVFVSSSLIFDLLSTNRSGCRLNLKSRKYLTVTQSCEIVHQSLPRD